MILTFICALFVLANSIETVVDTVVLDANALYDGYRIEKAVLASNNSILTIDLTNHKAPLEAIVETDIIDPADVQNNGISLPISYSKIKMTVNGFLPEGGTIELWSRFGAEFFSQKSWNPWVKAEGLSQIINGQKGCRYLQIRLILKSIEKDKLPVINNIQITAEREASLLNNKYPDVISFNNERLIKSSIPFEWERPDESKIAKFIKQTKYASAYNRRGTEMEKLAALNTAIAKTPNYDHKGWGADYPWNVYELGRFTKSGYEIKGHCMSYAALMVTVLTGLNHYARHWAISGFRDRDHEIVDVWVDSLRKWVYFDPSLSTYYLNYETKEPLSLVEMHDIFVKTFLKRGESTGTLTIKEQRDRVKSMGGGKSAPIICIDSSWHYGARNLDYDWGWETGYMTTCFLRLTTRNNFYSKREPWFPHFGGGIDHNTFLHYVDDQNSSPRSDSITVFSRRQRDFYPSMNQAAFKVICTGEKKLEFEFGNTQPFFKAYIVKIDNQKPVAVTKSNFIWNLKKGKNSLTVTPQNEWRRNGILSSLVVTLQ
jgi:hypothetical protein